MKFNLLELSLRPKLIYLPESAAANYRLSDRSRNYHYKQDAVGNINLALGFRAEWGKKSSTPNVGLEPTTLRLRVSCSTD